MEATKVQIESPYTEDGQEPSNAEYGGVPVESVQSDVLVVNVEELVDLEWAELVKAMVPGGVARVSNNRVALLDFGVYVGCFIEVIPYVESVEGKFVVGILEAALNGRVGYT